MIVNLLCSLREIAINVSAVQTPNKFNRVTRESDAKAIITYADSVQVPAATHFFDVRNLAQMLSSFKFFDDGLDSL